MHACVSTLRMQCKLLLLLLARTKYPLNAKARGCVVGGMVKNKKKPCLSCLVRILV